MSLPSKIKVTAMRSYPPPEPTSPVRHTKTMDWDAVHNPTELPSSPVAKKLASIHAIHGKARHVGGRWHSTFAHVEHDTGPLRRRLEGIEMRGQRATGEPWKVRVRLVDAYNERALMLLRGSGFVEAFHLLQGALELSLYDPEANHLTVGERGIGAMPEGRGTRLTALTLNNLAVYHRRRGQGRSSHRHLVRAQEIEGNDAAVSTQTNLCVLTAELGMPKAALAHMRCVMRRIADEVARGEQQPVERSAVVAVAAYNLGVALQALPIREARALYVDGADAWCFEAAIEMAHRDLGPSHPVSLAFRDPITADKYTPDGRRDGQRRVRLGRSVLGQNVDGSTYAVGWPQFTLIDLQESRAPLRRRTTVSYSALPPDSPPYSPAYAGVPLPPPLAPPPPPFYSTADVAYPQEHPRPMSAHPLIGYAPPPPPPPVPAGVGSDSASAIMSMDDFVRGAYNEERGD